MPTDAPHGWYTGLDFVRFSLFEGLIVIVFEPRKTRTDTTESDRLVGRIGLMSQNKFGRVEISGKM